jgi:hypothetical protein
LVEADAIGIVLLRATIPRHGLDPYTVEPMEGGCIMPSISDEQWASAIGPIGPPDNIENFAVSLIEAQRQFGENGRCRVGGLIELVTIREDQIESKILRRYAEDKIGQRIEPRAVDWEAWRRRQTLSVVAGSAGGAPMSRQQRRAAARAGR